MNSVVISSDSQKIISGSSDKTIKIWDIQSSTVLKTFEGNTDHVYSVAISSDNRRIVSCTWDDIKLWDMRSDTPIARFQEELTNVVAFSFDDQIIITGHENNTIKVRDAQDGEIIETFKGHTDDVNSVAISKDNQIIVSGSQDKTVKVW